MQQHIYLLLALLGVTLVAVIWPSVQLRRERQKKEKLQHRMEQILEQDHATDEIASVLVQNPGAKTQSKALERLGKLLNAQRICFLKLNKDGGLFSVVQEWRTPDTARLIPKMSDIPVAQYPKLMKDALAGHARRIHSVKDGELPEGWDAGSFIVAPVLTQHARAGILYADTPPKSPRRWTSSELRVLHYCGLFWAVSLDRLSTQTELVKAERRYNVALKATTEGLFDWNPLSDAIFLSGVLLDMLKIQGEQRPSTMHAFVERIPEENREHFLNSLVNKGGHQSLPFSLELPVHKEDSTLCWLRCVVRVIERAPTGEARRVMGTCKDITEIHNLQETLKQTHQEHTLLADTISEGVWEWELADASFTLSPSWFRLLGRAPEEDPIPLDTLVNLVHPKDRDGFRGHLDSFLTANDAPRSSRFRVQTSLGEYRWLYSRGRVVARDENNAVARVVGTHSDQSRIYEAEESARNAHDSKNTFLQQMHQELTAPVNGILGMAKLLEHSHLSADQENFVRSISSSGTVLKTLLTEIFDYTQLNASELTLDKRPFALREAIRDALHIQQPDAFARGCELVLDMDDSVPEFAIGDALRLRQIFSHILSSALSLKTPQEILLHISQRKDEERIRLDMELSILSAEKIALDEERPQLTLPVAKALATLMGGDLSITHDRERMTPHFSLHIILEEDPAHSPEPQADLPRKLSAFIFDNNASLVLGLSAQLKRWGLDVKHPHTEAELIQQLQEVPSTHSPLVLLNHRPGVQDAFLVMKKLALELENSLPVLIMDATGRMLLPPSETQAKIIRLTKPIESTELHKALHALVSETTQQMPGETPIHKQLLLTSQSVEIQAGLGAKLRQAGHQVTVSATAQESLPALRATPFDAFIFDAENTVIAPEESIRSLRASAQTGHRLKIIALSNGLHSETALMTAGADTVLPSPPDFQSLQKALELKPEQ
ncbi:PAS domain-containing protein [Desulfobaculum bizertense]|uniref:histidine kinase n=1 Tax=Desulfobaculum bizertense DSM 18034 TaxID=1121442 RepID=A0A1T4VT79_9BACT|nr:PAS domain-containing protein [Desulfobaculum bizertense]SKA68166.1 PAS fold-containing protein [Desulfobaculum bizertense DSM 18034]